MPLPSPKGPLIALGLASSLGLTSSLCAQAPDTPTLPGTDPSVPLEFGRIDWLRDFDAARRAATAAGNDMLMLFQEVPG